MNPQSQWLPVAVAEIVWEKASLREWVGEGLEHTCEVRPSPDAAGARAAKRKARERARKRAAKRQRQCNRR